MSNVTPLHADILEPLQDAIDAIKEHGPHRIVVILDGGASDGVFTNIDEEDTKNLLHYWHEQYLIDEILDRID